MVLCPRCNKNLSTNQALMYHLNRKVRCDAIKCPKCSQILSTQLELQMHYFRCTCIVEEPECIDPTILRDAFEHAPIGIVVVINDRVRYRNTIMAHVPIDERWNRISRHAKCVVDREWFKVAFVDIHPKPVISFSTMGASM